ncbi:hypothetical protein A2397_04690 [Candidatus Amesbacteria bacterium RIFOXYB1_FULL_44_23]|uniref:Uncharacterized protein n=1 Tax=Candidatus Amesbacteria bacterium RIFOXYB1_FULL_44_23 TaxID=1797263 RepID=A0A1F4ZQP3_9BACT|nr:MAG: hypothetical protein A2397_04690 [Candidatus Amesbacteria bacterium RIFOXYB1_FULL_44_23]
MSKTKIDITKSVMSKIDAGEIRMKPRWYFLLGSLGMLVGLVSFSIVTVFLISLVSFSLRTHGPMGEIRYQQLLAGFPWWAVGLSFIGLIGGVFLLKKYDFSYQKNFALIILAFVGSIILAGLAIDYLNLNSLWSKGGIMRGLYQRYDGGYGFRSKDASGTYRQSDQFWGRGRGQILNNLDN